MASFTAIVPARMGSTRFPGKALADIAGKPMVVQCALRARDSGAGRVVVATDHEDIASAARAAGVEVVLTRDDHDTGTDRLAEAVRLLALPPEALVVNVQGDEPLMAPEAIRAVAARLAESPDCAMATACYPIHDRAHFESTSAVKVVMNRAGEALYFSRAPIPWPRDAFQQGDSAWPAGLPAWHHVGLYAYRASFLQVFATLERSPLETFEALEQLRALWHGYRIAVVTTERAPAPGVDTPDDLERVRQLFDPRGVSR
ncbi:MAG: 3-deoxy-manno-octulosonate cytidylyltransferase [Betaproteobacteria bacterium]|nr:3-deoxy-manno-octulosonate cytidylyltransferase [Betaproteobacteria bacterium]MDE2622170.1 3-deoxy-manno-octulosonate cytidylyltransferase [Betaproteobacteria bacterium]